MVLLRRGGVYYIIKKLKWYGSKNSGALYNLLNFSGCLQQKYGKKSKRLPQVICIGAKKCGTGAFQNFLAHHPHLHKPPGLDEVHFFDNDQEQGLAAARFWDINLRWLRDEIRNPNPCIS